MSEQERIEQLDAAIADLLSGGAGTPGLRALAATLREAPDEAFRTSLKASLIETARAEIKEKNMAITTSWLREGMHTVNPYLVTTGADALIKFMEQTFGAKERERVKRPDGTIMHAEVQLGESVVELADGSEQYPPRPVALHVYVTNADETYQRALDAGATSMHAPVDQEYGDREGGVKDASGNFWYIATHRLGEMHVPLGLRTVTPYLHPKGTAELIEFLKRAFNAEEGDVHRGADGSVMHAKIRIGNSYIEMGEAHGQFQPMPAYIHLYVENTDAGYQQALDAGATAESAPADQPYGDRRAGVVDPWGNTWWLATFIGETEKN